MTINSQPNVNGVKSSDETFGWGGPGGRVYQKSYLEFFLSAEKFDLLRSALNDFPSVTYLATTMDGDLHTNMGEKSVNAVTWGVFPGKEIIQPTIVDSESFKIWKEEAFAIWHQQWAQLYEEESPSRALLDRLQKELVLVNMVENDYVDGELMEVFRKTGLV